MNAYLAVLAVTTILSVPETWHLKMWLEVPRIYANTESLGYRKYQRQVVEGRFAVTSVPGLEPDIEILSLTNRTHKVNGQRVTYDAWVDEGETLWHGIGSNLTGIFNVRSVSLKLWAEPSYAIGPSPTEDNSLIVTLAGRGNSIGTYISGYVAGQLGCGCKEYGHVSPTRIWGQDAVRDTASVQGRWTARRED